MSAPSAPASPGIDVCCRTAFTLIELLVSISVLALLIAFMGQMLNQASQMWSHGEANTRVFQSTRAMSDAISAELRTALIPVDRTSRKGLQIILNPSQISASYKNPCALFWQTPAATDQSLGDAAEIGYFVRWDTTSTPGNPRAMLCRFFVNPGSKSVADSNYLIHSQPDAWLSDTILQAVAPATASKSYQGLFADDVIGLWIRCFDSYGKPITLDYTGASLKGRFDSRLGYTDSQGVKSPDYIDANGQKQPLDVLPPVVEVSLALLDGQAAARVSPAVQQAIMALTSQLISNNPNANAKDFVTAALLPGSGLNTIGSGLHTYATRVYLQNSKWASLSP